MGKEEGETSFLILMQLQITNICGPHRVSLLSVKHHSEIHVSKTL